MSKIEKICEILGEENIKRIKSEIANIIIDAVRDDVESYDREEYLLEPDEIIEFVRECRDEAFSNVKKELVASYEAKIRKGMEAL